LVKLEILERISELLGVSIASLLDAGVEYHSNVVSFFERMRQIELTSERVLAHYEPISFVLSSDQYNDHLRQMLIETLPANGPKADLKRQIDDVLRILSERKIQVRQKQPNIASIIGDRLRSREDSAPGTRGAISIFRIRQKPATGRGRRGRVTRIWNCAGSRIRDQPGRRVMPSNVPDFGAAAVGPGLVYRLG
jgi:hypothetical protein